MPHSATVYSYTVGETFKGLCAFLAISDTWEYR